MDKKPKKILIISSFFEQKFGYQETHIANTLASLGHQVKVLTTNESQFTKNKISNNNSYNYGIIRISKFIRITETIFPYDDLSKYIYEFEPDIVFLIHVGHGLPYYAIKSLKETYKIVSFFGDLKRHYKSIQRKLTTNLFKDDWYYKTFVKSDIIISNTNETTKILYKKCKGNKELRKKIYRLSLGFDQDKFYFDKNIREKTRNEYNFGHSQIVLCTTTKIVTRKPIISWIKPIIEVIKNNRNLIYCLVGFFENDKYCNFVKREINKLYKQDNLILLNYLDQTKLNKLYNASDYSLWFAESITIQESMGTGLKAIIPNIQTVNHLIDDRNGYIFKNNISLLNIIESLPKEYNRNEIYKYNNKFSYFSILNRIFNKLY